jgi:hypothetical protein
MRLSSSSSLFRDHIPTNPTPIVTIHFFPYTANLQPINHQIHIHITTKTTTTIAFPR